MKIVADENIPYIKEACAGLGEVETMGGRAMTAEKVKDADILFVRSVTKVNESLLSGSKVKFAATATIGMDHIDRKYLAEKGIGFSSAPGSNANSVAEYVTAALLTVSRRKEIPLEGKTLGIVGVGNVGSRVEKKAVALGMKVLRNDPPRAEAEGGEGFVTLDELLEKSDAVTLHTPLEKAGNHPTYHLADADFFAKLKKGAIFINSSRGAVCSGAALLKAINDGKTGAVVLDVWEGEPDISPELLEAIDLGTPHIAGYSFDGKVNGTEMIVNAARDFFKIAEKWDPKPHLPLPEVPLLKISAENRTKDEIVRKAVLALYDISEDDLRLRRLPNLPKEERAGYFDALRKSYPRRREFQNTLFEISGEGEVAEKSSESLNKLGFRQNSR